MFRTGAYDNGTLAVSAATTEQLNSIFDKDFASIVPNANGKYLEVGTITPKLVSEAVKNVVFEQGTPSTSVKSTFSSEKLAEKQAAKNETSVSS